MKNHYIKVDDLNITISENIWKSVCDLHKEDPCHIFMETLGQICYAIYDGKSVKTLSGAVFKLPTAMLEPFGVNSNHIPHCANYFTLPDLVERQSILFEKNKQLEGMVDSLTKEIERLAKN